MIGKVVDKTLEAVVIQVGGIGYTVNMPSRSIGKLPVGEEAALYTHLQVRDDALVLYGFLEERERELFHMLIGVTGVGPKVAVGMMSGFSSDDIVRFIRAGDVRNLTKAPGIGKKTAERILLELKDKVEHMTIEPSTEGEAAIEDSKVSREVYEALVGLGYSGNEAKKAIDATEEGSVETMLKDALRRLSNS
nr:Holliday junction branch migration protein RuvA [Peptoniphilus sp.]